VVTEGHVDKDEFAAAVHNPPQTETHSCVMTYHAKQSDRFCSDHLLEIRDKDK
jgi:hypothetical protein